MYLPLGAHLVGSVPLESSEGVFRTVAERLGDWLRRVPDGETGPRADWIVWQYSVLSARPQFEVGSPTPEFYRALPRLRLRHEADVSGLEFGSLGYAVAALGSYATFRQLKRNGEIPLGCRLQVCLPTPLAPISAFVSLDDQSAVEPAYEAAMTRREPQRAAGDLLVEVIGQHVYAELVVARAEPGRSTNACVMSESDGLAAAPPGSVCGAKLLSQSVNPGDLWKPGSMEWTCGFGNASSVAAATLLKA